jgi:polyisoprenyl-phosphate glycosyltransferase
VVPLRIATYLGLTISIVTFLGLVGYAFGRLFLGKTWPPDFATIIILILGSLSLNALFLGIIGEYLGRIYRQVNRRPLTIVERELNPVGVRRNEFADSRSIDEYR